MGDLIQLKVDDTAMAQVKERDRPGIAWAVYGIFDDSDDGVACMHLLCVGAGCMHATAPATLDLAVVTIGATTMSTTLAFVGWARPNSGVLHVVKPGLVDNTSPTYVQGLVGTWFQTSRKYRSLARLPPGMTGKRALYEAVRKDRDDAERWVAGMPEWSAGDHYLRCYVKDADQLELTEEAWQIFAAAGGRTYGPPNQIVVDYGQILFEEVGNITAGARGLHDWSNLPEEAKGKWREAARVVRLA